MVCEGSGGGIHLDCAPLHRSAIQPFALAWERALCKLVYEFLLIAQAPTVSDPDRSLESRDSPL